MIYRIISDQLKLSSVFKETTRTGDVVTLNVVKQLTDRKWAVSIKGKVFPARSEFDLTPGDKIKAQVLRSGNRLILKVVNDSQKPIQELLSRYGIVGDTLSESIVTSLVRSNLKVTQEIVSKIRKFMERTKKNDLKTSRLLSLILCKDIDISGIGIEELVQLLSYGDSSHDRQKRKKSDHDTENEEDTKKWLKKVIQKTSENTGNLLHIFNHLNGKSQNWIVIPYSYHDKSKIYEGTIRVLYNPISKKTEKVVFTVVMDEKDRITFYMQQKEEFIHIMMFSSGLEDHVHFEKNLQELRIKLQNKGAKIDDIVYNEKDFDGFTPRTDVFPYKTIDTLT